MLAERFCAEAATRNAIKPPTLARDALARLEAGTWPGNVRELQSCVERLVVFADGGVIGAADVDRDEERSRPLPTSESSSRLGERREEAERRAVQEALTRAAGNRTLAARLLGVSRRTLYNKLAELGLG
jgi:DNA-binding NtrC family response regulator